MFNSLKRTTMGYPRGITRAKGARIVPSIYFFIFFISLSIQRCTGPFDVKAWKRKHVLHISHKLVDFSELQAYFGLDFVKEKVHILYSIFFSVRCAGEKRKK